MILIAQNPLRGWTGVLDDAFRIDDYDQICGVLNQRMEAALAMF